MINEYTYKFEEFKFHIDFHGKKLRRYVSYDIIIVQRPL